MHLEHYFRNVRQYIEKAQYDQLHDIPLKKPEHFNWVNDVFEAINIHDHAETPALIWTDGTREKTFTFEEISDKSNQLLNLLRANGVKQHDVILLQMPLLAENWLAYVAAIKGGFRIIPAATILGVNDLVYRFGKLMPKAVITDVENAVKINEAEALSGKTVHVKILVGGAMEGWKSFGEADRQPVNAKCAKTRADDPLFLFFTSGTTGMPKVVTHTHLSYPLGHLTTASWIGLHKGDLHCNIAQPGWAKYAWSSFFAPWNMGAAIFAYNPPGRFHAKEQLEQIEKYKVTTLCAPPTALRMLILEDLKQFNFSLRECVAAGEPLNPEVIEAWKTGTGLTIRDGYGQTESSAMVANLPGSNIKFGSMGKPTFLYDIVIASDEGKEMPVHEEGSIAVKTTTGRPNGIFVDYFDDTEKKKEVFKHSLYYTGDKAYKDEDGYIWFVGRDDDVIKSSDYRVGPFEVESVLMEHEAVVESAVVGSPHEVKGFLVKAFIILHPSETGSLELAQEIYAFARKNLAPYKVPRIIEFVTELPKTISGKIRRVELRATEAQKRAKKETSGNEYFF